MKLAWLYDDLLDLYGDRGNIMALQYRLREAGCEPEIVRASVGDEVDFSQFALVYIGPGLFSNLAVAAADLLERKAAVLAAIEAGTPFLVTGNATALFSEGFTDAAGAFHEGLGLFPQRTVEGTKIIIHDIVMNEKGGGDALCAFFNSTAETAGQAADWFFDLRTADGKPRLAPEGQRHRNFYGTALLGPLLVRNPQLLHKFVDLTAGKHVEFNDAAEVEAQRRILRELTD